MEFVTHLAALFAGVLLGCAVLRWQQELEGSAVRDRVVRIYDGACLNCGLIRYWYGSWCDMPPCARCGERPDRSVLEELDRVMGGGQVKPKSKRLNRDGLPVDGRDWLEDDWRDLWVALETVTRKVRERHGTIHDGTARRDGTGCGTAGAHQPTPGS